MILLRFQRVLFLRSCPVFPCPCPFAAFGSVCGTGGAVKGVMLGRSKCLLAFPTPPPSNRGSREQGSTQASIQGEDGGAEPFAYQRVGDALRADTFLTVVQEQAIPAIVVAALPYQSPGGSVLLIGHVRNFRRYHFTRSPDKILKTPIWHF